MEKTLQDLIEYLRGKDVYVQTHDFPDPDAIASGWGLKKLLSYYGIESTLCYAGTIDRVNTRRMIDMLGIEIVSKDSVLDEMKKDDPIICVDSQKNSGNIVDLVGDEVACIDHHRTAVKTERYYYKDVRMTGSCSTLVALYFELLGAPMDRNTATALLYGIKTDTAAFTRGVTGEDIRAFAYLFEMADNVILSDLERNQMEVQDLRAYGAAIEGISISDNVGFAVIPFTCPDALVALVADFILSLNEVRVAVVYSSRADGVRFSVRSEEPDVKANLLIAGVVAGVGSGGGHDFMAGGFIPRNNLVLLGEQYQDAIRERILMETAAQRAKRQRI